MVRLLTGATDGTGSAQARCLELAEPLQARLEELAGAVYPREACGLLVGFLSTVSVRVCAVHPARNLSDAQNRFDIDPGEVVRIDREARAEGLEICGVWHSHPDRPAVPSAVDLGTSWSLVPHVIVSVEEGVSTAIRVWRIGPDRTSLELDLVGHARAPRK